MRSFHGAIRTAEQNAQATALYKEVADLLRGRDLDQVVDVLINHTAGVVVANGIDPHRMIEGFKQAERAYRDRTQRSPIWVPP